ncbi:hypothetical protein DFH29DRAFT_1010806 [Suillus ampliporus]|nr:hypothetical protein DFH29DRAFT_1010806 [Suillus ampliporus]
MSAFSFASLAADPIEDDPIRRQFNAIREKLVGVAKSVPDDKDELLEEKEDWMRIWVDLTTRLSACVSVAKEKGIVLALPADEVAAGEAGASMYNHFYAQVSMLKAAAIRTPEPDEQNSTSVATGTVTRKKSVMEVSVPDVPGVSRTTRSKAVPPRMSAKTSIDPNFILHDPPCSRCQAKDALCEGPDGQGCTTCRSAKQACDYATGSRAAVRREKPDTGKASAVSASAAGSIRCTVSSPTLDSVAKDASSDGESEAPADPTPRRIRPRPTRRTNKGKSRAINVDESADEKSKLRMENDELRHGLRLAQGKLLKMYEMVYDLADELKKMEAKLADRK